MMAMKEDICRVKNELEVTTPAGNVYQSQFLPWGILLKPEDSGTHPPTPAQYKNVQGGKS